MSVLNQTMVTEAEIDAAYGNANFGDMSKIDVVRFGVLKRACGYHQGYTSRQISIDLGLIDGKTKQLTDRGKFCLWEWFNERTTL